MLRLGVHLSLRSGKEALIRLVLTAIAVMLGVTMLLSALASYHAFQATNNKPHWWFPDVAEQGSLLWLYRTDVYGNQDIKRVDIAVLEPNAPLIPGLDRMPGPGEFFVSPALSELINTVPAEELGSRFPGKQAGLINDEALLNSHELLAVVGRSPDELRDVPQAFLVDNLDIPSSPHRQTNFFSFLFAIGMLSILLPILVLVTMATRLSASRQEERYAAIRLAGATPGQVNVIASTDAFLGAAIGTILGVFCFLFLHAVVTRAAIDYLPYHPRYITPTMLGYLTVGIGVPLISVVAALLSLRRVRISPLGVSRKTTPKPPNLWQVVPLVAGLAIFVSGAAVENGLVMGAGFLLIMFGLILGGPWITMQLARILGNKANGAVVLLAARRLASNPGSAFKPVSGLVLAVFVGTVFACIAPTLLADQQNEKVNTLEHVLTVSFYDQRTVGLSADAGAELIEQLREDPGVEVFPIYATPSSIWANSREAAARYAEEGIDHDPTIGYITCEDLASLAAIGDCAPDVQVTAIFTSPLILDHNISDQTVIPGTSTTNVELSTLPVQALLIRSDGASSLEKARTLLANKTITTDTPPRTFGEIRQYEQSLVNGIQRIIYAAIVVTLIIAGASLAVAIGDGLMERKRPFMLLRLSGTPVSVLNKVVLLESIAPLFLASLVAAVVGFGAAATLISTVAPDGSTIQPPVISYYLVMGGSLLTALLVICAPLPLLDHMTKSDNARFE